MEKDLTQKLETGALKNRQVASKADLYESKMLSRLQRLPYKVPLSLEI